MAISILQSNFASGTTPSLSVSFGSSVTTGSTVIMVGGAGTSAGFGIAMYATVSGSSTQVGNTQRPFSQTAANGNYWAAWTRTTTSNDNGTYTLTNGNGSIAENIWIYEVAGLDLTTIPPVYVVNNAIGSNTTSTSATLTTTASKEMFLCGGFWAQGGNMTPTTVSSPLVYTQFTTARSAMATAVVASSASSYAPTFNWTSARTTASFVLALYGEVKASSTLMMTGMGA